MINDDKQKSSTNQKCEKIEFDECSKYVLMIPRYEKNQKTEKGEKSILMDIQNNCFGETPVYLRGVIFLAQILRALLSNKNGIFNF